MHFKALSDYRLKIKMKNLSKFSFDVKVSGYLYVNSIQSKLENEIYNNFTGSADVLQSTFDYVTAEPGTDKFVKEITALSQAIVNDRSNDLSIPLKETSKLQLRK